MGGKTFMKEGSVAKKSRDDKSQKSSAPAVGKRISELAPALLVSALVLFQGGYYAGATCVIASIGLALYAVMAFVRRDIGNGVALQPAVFVFAVAILLGVSALAHGPSATMLLETASWFAVAGMALWCVQDTASSRNRMLDTLAVSGVFLAGLGILMFVGAIPFEGSVSAGRLMFTFQYANAAGLYFAVIAVLCLGSTVRRLRFAAAVPIVALAMTQSVGALAVFGCALIALGVRFVRTERPDARIVAGATVGVVVAVVLGAWLLWGRLQQATQTFIERMVQILDAMTCLAGNAALGIGPDCWQFEYPFLQTAQYRAANVHSSYVQIALDGGVLAALATLALVVFGLVMLVRRREYAPAVCAGMVAVHALFDFDFQFSAITLLLAALVSIPADGAGNVAGAFRGKKRKEQRPERTGGTSGHVRGIARDGAFVSRIACSTIAICSLAASIGGICLDIRSGEVQNACARGDARGALVRIDETSLFSADTAMRSQVVQAAFSSGDYSLVLDVTGADGNTAAMGLYRAVSLYELGREGESLDVFEQVLRSTPYDPDLYAAVMRYIVERSLSDEFVDMYNEQAQRANSLILEGHAAWLDNQKSAEPIA